MLTEDVVNLLKSKGSYRVVQQPLRVVDVEFKKDFEAVLEGPDNQRALVLVFKAAGPSLKIIQRRLRALSLVLNRTESMRPVTLVLVTNEMIQPGELAALEAIYRVIVVSADANLDKSLRTLLPLKLPLERVTKSVDGALRQELGTAISDPLIGALLDAARKGSSEVERVMRQHVDNLARSASTGGETL